MNRKKLCFSLLNYRKDTHRHYYHIYEFIEALAAKTDVRLLVMDAMDEPEFSNPTGVVNLSGRGITARIKRDIALMKAWLDGYRVFYHHYTMAPARFSAILTRLLGGKTYLWHCIVMDALDKAVGSGNLNKWILKCTFHMIDSLVTGTPAMAEFYASRYGLKLDSIKVIPNYINQNRFNQSIISKKQARRELEIPEDKNVVLYLHEIEEGRAGHLAPIVEAVLARRSDTMFLIAGDGRYRKNLETQLETFKSDGRVRFEGSVPNIDTPRYYAMADVYIMTSDFEAFSRVLLESMAMGIPYVATDGDGAIRSYTPQEHQSYILAREHLDQFPLRIDTLLDDREEADRMVRAGLEHVRRYSLDVVLEQFISDVLS
jgi:glycosyltransferase involved in cell wall biosynthesis